jgi:ectoine hydroxylase-related dioxygenase (phytanoyl-CoA dioxygenase family)
VSQDLYFQNKQETGAYLYPLDAAAAETGTTLLIPASQRSTNIDAQIAARAHTAMCAPFVTGGEILRSII